MDLSIIIVNYNVRAYLEQCLRSVFASRCALDFEVYVVDNHSTDGSVAYLKGLYPQVHFIENDENLGFARANNEAIRCSKGRYVLLLNPDTIVTEHTLVDCVSYLDTRPDAGGLGTYMLRTDGSFAYESRRGLPTPFVAFCKMSGLCKMFPHSRLFGKYYMRYLNEMEESEIEVISGAFMMLRRSALEKVGLLDEAFFMYGEDIDLSYRLLRGGYENWYLPTKILHYKGESTQKSSFRYVHVFYDAMLIFFRKHYAHASLFFTIPIKAAIYGKALVELCRMQLSRARRSLGFVSKRASQPAYYVFIGTAPHLDTCRQLANAKGLDAQFVEGNEESLPEGHLNMSLPSERDVYVVYDIEAYRFQSIFRIFSSRPVEWVAMGTFLPEERIIITTEEVLK